MKISDISLPEIYKESSDFRFFLKWFENSLTQIKYDTENLIDLYDPQRCKSELLWLLADTMGFKFDDRLPVAFNRLVLIYFMSMIRHKGSRNGVTLAAEVNLRQFDIDLVAGKGYTNSDGEFIPPKDVLYDRLEDTSIPVNSVYVTPHTEEGYIDIVYFSAKKPIDACVEYVRPLGMYCFQHAGVKVDTRTKISVDARLTNMNDLAVSIGPTRVGHYSREDYARLQKTRDKSVSYDGVAFKQNENDFEHIRRPVYHTNSEYEQNPNNFIRPGYRALYSLQLSNNEHIVKSLIPEKQVDPDSGVEIVVGQKTRDPIFSVGYGPQDVSVRYPDDYLDRTKYSGDSKYDPYPEYNLMYDRKLEESTTRDVYTVESSRTQNVVNPRPAVNPVMSSLGDAISLNKDNTKYSEGDGTDVLGEDIINIIEVE